MEEHQVAAPRRALALGAETQELLLGSAGNQFAVIAVDILGEPGPLQSKPVLGELPPYTYGTRPMNDAADADTP